MKTARIFSTVALSAALTLGAALSPAIADDDPSPRGQGMMMGGMGGGGMMGQEMMGGMMGPGMMGLDLTDEQRARIERITYEAHKKHLELMSAMLEESHKLQETMAAKKPDPATVGNATLRVHDLKRQTKELHADTHKRIEALLTKEQREKLEHAGHGCMMK
ncbi:MAG: Spy/CpxP family protein refolding chaperone [Sulfuricella sp.]|nr:Spy/CpxP family protein refolding chaperone [Sulfuricella sp.]